MITPLFPPKTAGLPVCLFFLCITISTSQADQAPAPPQQAFELESCIRQAIENSYGLRGSECLADAAEANSSQARARRWPTIGTSWRYDYASEVTGIDIPAGPGLPGNHIRLGDENRYAFAVGVEVPVFTGGSLSANAQAEEAGARAARHDLDADRLRVVREVRAAFYQALGARAGADAATVAADRLRRHIRDLEQQVDVGTASREMHIQAAVRLTNTEQLELAMEENLATTQLLLGNLLGRPGERITPSGLLDKPQIQDYDVAHANVDAKPELAALASRHEQSRLRTRAAAGSRWPSIAANTYVNYGRPGVDLVQNEWMSWVSAGVSVSWTLWDWGARGGEIHRAEATARALEARRSQVNRQLENELAIAQTRLRLAAARHDKATERVELERQRLELVRGRYAEGMAAETEFLDAHDDLAEAEALLASSLAAVRLAEVDLLYASGK